MYHLIAKFPGFVNQFTENKKVFTDFLWFGHNIFNQKPLGNIPCYTLALQYNDQLMWIELLGSFWKEKQQIFRCCLKLLTNFLGCNSVPKQQPGIPRIPHCRNLHQTMSNRLYCSFNLINHWYIVEWNNIDPVVFQDNHHKRF